MRATSFLQHGPAPPQCALTQSTSSTVVVEQRKVSACFSKTIGVSSEAHSWSDSLERAAAPSSLITNSRFGVLSYTRAHVFRLPSKTRVAYRARFNVVGIYITTSLVVSGGSFVVSGGAAVPTTAIETASRGLGPEEKFRAHVNPTASARRRHPTLRTMEAGRTLEWRQ